MDSDKLLTTTRAVRKRLDLDRPVPPELITECLDIAIQAPTGSNAQGWRFLVLTEPEPKAIVADAYKRAWDVYKPATAPGGQMGRVIDSAGYLADNMARVPAMLIPCVQPRVPSGSPDWMYAGIYGSIMPAVWSFQLAARARGLGTVLTTLHLMHGDEVAAALGIPDTHLQAAMVPIGYYTGTDFKPAARNPVSSLTSWERW